MERFTFLKCFTLDGQYFLRFYIHFYPFQHEFDIECHSVILSLYDDSNLRKKYLLGGKHFEENFDFTYFRSSACARSEEHTSELQSRFDIVCRLLLDKKNIVIIII